MTHAVERKGSNSQLVLLDRVCAKAITMNGLHQ